jgi:hypothetical protein
MRTAESLLEQIDREEEEAEGLSKGVLPPIQDRREAWRQRAEAWRRELTDPLSAFACTGVVGDWRERRARP